MKKLRNSQVRKILCALRAGLQALYGPRLRGLYLYGSYARGEADAESDLDMLVVLDKVENYHRELEATGELISDLCLKHETAISWKFVSEKRWANRDSGFLVNVREDAIAA